MKNKLYTWLFSLASVLIVRLSVFLTGIFLGYGALGEDGPKALNDEDKATATAAAEVAAERLKEDGNPAQIAVALTVLLGLGFEWLKSSIIARGAKETQMQINGLMSVMGTSGPIAVDGLPLAETNRALALARLRLAAKVKEGFPSGSGNIASRVGKWEGGKVEEEEQAATPRAVADVLNKFPALVLVPLVAMLSLTGIGCSTLEPLVPGGAGSWEKIQSVTDKIAVNGKVRPLATGDGIELCLQVRKRPDIDASLVEIAVDASPGK